VLAHRSRSACPDYARDGPEVCQPGIGPIARWTLRSDTLRPAHPAYPVPHQGRNRRLTRHIRFLTKDGIAGIRVRGSKAASDTARHWAAVKHYLLTGETEALAEFHGRSIRADGVTYPFITDPATLERIHAAGETSFERLYTQRG